MRLRVPQAKNGGLHTSCPQRGTLSALLPCESVASLQTSDLPSASPSACVWPDTRHTSQNPDEAGRLPPRGRRFPQHTAPLFGRSLLVKNVSNFLHTGLVLCSLCCKLHPRLTAWWQVAS